MIISIIVAFDKVRTIGFRNRLPWHLPADLKHFKSVTMGHSIIMGRKTFESIGKPLPGRKSVVITNNIGYFQEGITVVHSIEQAIHECKNESEVFIIGGAQIFRHSLHLADKLYVTKIHHHFEGDTWFPEISNTEWVEGLSEENEPDEFFSNPKEERTKAFLDQIL